MDPNTITPPPQNNPPLFSSPSLPNLPDLPQQPPKDKKTKLIMGAVIALVVISAVGLLAVVLRPKEGSNTAQQQIPTFNANSETVRLSEEFLQSLAANKFSEASLMLKPEGTITREQFEDEVAAMNYVAKNYPISQCQTEGSTSGNTVVAYTCKKSDGTELVLQITARDLDGKTVLSGVSIIHETDSSS